MRVETRHMRETGGLALTLINPGSAALTVQVADNAYGQSARTVTLPPGASVQQSWALQASGFWYDLTVSVAGTTREEIRLAGHVETGTVSITDPAATAPVLA